VEAVLKKARNLTPAQAPTLAQLHPTPC